MNELKDALFEQFARVGKALASPKRLELLDVLAQGERSVESLADATSLKLSTASAHLQSLARGGLVDRRKFGTRIFYRLAGEDVAKILSLVSDVAVSHLADAEQAADSFLGEDSRRTVSREELLDGIAAGRMVLVDTRPQAEYDAGHLTGARSIPLDELADRLDELPADVEVVAYCRGRYCALSYEAVRILRRRHIPARRLDFGMVEWLADSRPKVTI